MGAPRQRHRSPHLPIKSSEVKRPPALPRRKRGGERRCFAISNVIHVIKKRDRFSALFLLVTTISLLWWTIQWVDVLWAQFFAKRLGDSPRTIPDYDIPKNNWLVPLRFLRPHNKRLVWEAQTAINELGDELRDLLGSDAAIALSPESFGLDLADVASDSFRERLHSRAKWLRGDFHQPNWPLSVIPKPLVGQAVVINGGDKQLHYIKALVYTISIIHESKMPIRIVYKDDNDLTEPSKVEILDVLKSQTTDTTTDEDVDISFINLSKYFDLDAVQLKGWNLKAFGMLAVPETQVMSLDADVMLFQPPESLFEAKPFQNTGALFYHDRVKPEIDWDLRAFLRWLRPNLSEQASKLLWYGGPWGWYTQHVQEAGVILIDKERRYLGLWAACLVFGREDIRRYIQVHNMYGDKEVYWSSFEMIGEPFVFARYYPGVVGGLVTDMKGHTIDLPQGTTNEQTESEINNAVALSGSHLCGRMLHFDEENNPLWSNGGYMLKDEDYKTTAAVAVKGLNPAYFIDGGDSFNEEFINPWLPYLRNINMFGSIWYHLFGGTLKNQNQVWAFNKALGSECLLPNARYLQLVEMKTATKARKAVDFYLGHQEHSRF